MKKTKIMKFILALVAVVGSMMISHAQSDEGHFIYDIKMESSDPQIEAQLSMLAGSTLEIMFKGQQSKQIMSMGSLMTTTTITDSETKEGLMLMNGMMGKFAARMDLDEAAEEEEDGDLDIELVDETKDVLGYTCHKAIIIDGDGNETTFWYSKDFASPETESQYIKKGIPGMPLAFSVDTPQMSMSFEAKEINEKIKKSKKEFNMDIPEGYEEKDIEELQGAMGG